MLSAIEITNVSKSVFLPDTPARTFKEKVNRVFKKSPKEQFFILKDINLKIPKLSTLGIIGENGSGKSSLLKLIANISSPTEGSIKHQGKIAAILDIGSGFHPELTGRENIDFYGKILGMTQREIDASREEIIDFSDIRDFIDSPIKYYSNGMYLRLAFSIAVHSQVDIILFDEVLAVGDNAFHIKCFQKINELKKDTTIVLVSHSMDDITRICNQCLWLEKGKIKGLGDTHEIVSQYVLNTLEKDGKITNYFKQESKFEFTPYNYQNKFILSDFFTYSDQKEKTKVIDYDEEFYFKFNLEVIENPEIPLLPTIQLVDKNNVNIIFSTSVYQGPPFFSITEKGNYTIECRFPKRNLNKGIYRVHFYLFDIETKPHFSYENATIFKINARDKDLDFYISKTSFSLIPSLNWFLDKADNL